jgi:hypothetical protein
MAANELTNQLHQVLRDVRDTADEILGRLDGDDLSAAEVVGLLESLAQLDRERADVLGRYRSAAVGQLRRRGERSIRQYVLAALQQIATPQTAGFLEDYLYATELVEFKSRGVGSLRRDEFSAWHSDRQKDRLRVAYIVPCLDESGRKTARWLARSDWPLARRVLVDGAEPLWLATRVVALIRAFAEAEAEVAALFSDRIIRHAREALGDATVDEALTRADRYDELEREATAKIEQLERRVRNAQEQVAGRLSDLPPEQQIWGVSTA